MKSSLSSRLLALTAAFVALPTLAQAHPGLPGHVHSGFAPGVLHPISGADHILAMVAVGLWAAQLGRRALWAVPASFVSVMVLGGALGMAGMHVPFVEQGILASVFILGLLVMTAARLPLAVCMAIVSAFAFFHGLAHGAEMPANAAGVTYGAGFALSTALLHACGIAAGLGLGQMAKSSWLRLAGGAIVAGGCAMAFGLI